ncbi:MAG TPA: type II secretion system protein GspG [Candidatus Babeliaceae bacterium]|nr:type II secretion system protein GspG [Candidatus Babeliaceae bacterium]
MMNSVRSGFTLIEIVIAITIIAILGAVAGPPLFKWIAKGKVTATNTTLKAVNTAIQTFQADTSTFPTSLSELLTRPSEEKIAKRWDGPYLEKEPLDGWKRELQYQLNPRGAQPPYELYSWGPNGEGSPEEEWIKVQDI